VYRETSNGDGKLNVLVQTKGPIGVGVPDTLQDVRSRLQGAGKVSKKTGGGSGAREVKKGEQRKGKGSVAAVA